MRELDYKKINAFTSADSLGNPAACIYLKENEMLLDEDMLAIAKQHKGFVSEVVYCKKTESGKLHLTFFSSEREVDFCGHGTIACMYSLIKNSPDLIKQQKIPVMTRKKGEINIYNRINEENTIYITAPDPIHLSTDMKAELLADYLGIQQDSISGLQPIDFIDAGLRTLIVPIIKLTDEVNMYPDQDRLEEFTVNNGIDIILVYSLDTADPDCYAHTRVFAAKYGYLEDPATGSGNSAFGYYLMKNHMWEGTPIAIEQGGSYMTYNTVKLYADNNQVLFGGSATDCIVGKYYL
jgi:PhzF family phenazine biosynthesis protein